MKSVSIAARLDSYHLGQSPATADYLTRIGMEFSSGFEEHILHIEFREIPRIITQCEDFALHSTGQAMEWTIDRITKEGIHLYYVHEKPVFDGFVFIPMNNVLCIHTIDEGDLKQE